MKKPKRMLKREKPDQSIDPARYEIADVFETDTLREEEKGFRLVGAVALRLVPQGGKSSPGSPEEIMVVMTPDRAREIAVVMGSAAESAKLPHRVAGRPLVFVS